MDTGLLKSFCILGMVEKFPFTGGRATTVRPVDAMVHAALHFRRAPQRRARKGPDAASSASRRLRRPATATSGRCSTGPRCKAAARRARVGGRGHGGRERPANARQRHNRPRPDCQSVQGGTVVAVARRGRILVSWRKRPAGSRRRPIPRNGCGPTTIRTSSAR
jgi:hypothetical protein